MSFPELSPTAAHAQLAQFRVIDVREEHEFHGPLGFVTGSELVPLSTLAQQADKLAGAGPLLLVCRSGRRSGKACEDLQALGVEDVTNLAGGMIAWNRSGLPCSRSEPKTRAELRDGIISWLAQVGPLTEEAARQMVRERFARQDLPYDTPTLGALEELIEFVANLLGEVDPPDLDLSLASFRSSLAVL